MNWKILVGVLGMVMGIGGCVQTHQVKDQDIKTGFLVNSYPLLQPGKEGEGNLVYMNPKAKWKNYNKIMLDAVSVWFGKDSQASDTGVVPPDDVRALANSFYKKLSEHLSKDYTIVQSSGPDVMRLSVALTDIEHGMPLLDSISTVALSPIYALDKDRKVASSTHFFVGHANVEGRIVDSMSGELLGAGIDQRAGGRKLGKGIGFWRDVENVFDYWAAKIRWRLCKQRGGKDCQAPD
ncbi:MAG: DUF3313 domain-containing protein [Nitrospirota bacterium]